ncbi:MAG TPA: hypothetical protein VIF02_14160 [Methylocella sp.]
MQVRNDGDHWAVYISAGGTPNGASTAADCSIIAYGKLRGDEFVGELKYMDEEYPERGKWRDYYDPKDSNAISPGHKITVKFKMTAADVQADTFGVYGMGDGVSRRYRKE